MYTNDTIVPEGSFSYNFNLPCDTIIIAAAVINSKNGLAVIANWQSDYLSIC